MAEAVGSMCHLMASDKLEEQIPRLVPAILSLYKKNNEHYIISKVMHQCRDCLLWVFVESIIYVRKWRTITL